MSLDKRLQALEATREAPHAEPSPLVLELGRRFMTLTPALKHLVREKLMERLR